MRKREECEICLCSFIYVFRYLVDVHWFKQLKKFLGIEDGSLKKSVANGGDQVVPGSEGEEEEGSNLASSHPGPIDNGPLYQKDPGKEKEIREHMIDELDYQLLPEEAWKVLVEAFGTTPGQEPIIRKVVENGMFIKHYKVEVYFVEILMAENSNTADVKKCKFSKSDTLGEEQRLPLVLCSPARKEASNFFVQGQLRRRCAMFSASRTTSRPGSGTGIPPTLTSSWATPRSPSRTQDSSPGKS